QLSQSRSAQGEQGCERGDEGESEDQRSLGVGPCCQARLQRPPVPRWGLVFCLHTIYLLQRAHAALAPAPNFACTTRPAICLWSPEWRAVSRVTRPASTRYTRSELAITAGRCATEIS